MRAFLQKQWVRVTAYVMAVIMVLSLIGGIALIIYSAEQNKTIILSEYTVTHADIPAAFEGKRILQLTDFHNTDFGEQLTTFVKAQAPDIIVITGDWISRDDSDIAVAKRQANALVGIAPVYYVAGNHEAYSPFYEELCTYFDSLGFFLLDSATTEWREGDEAVQMIGLYDPEFSTHLHRDAAPLVDEERYTILLYHRPEYLEQAAEHKMDLVLSGHSHGGQVRLPLIGAVYASNQGLFPKYDRGRFTCGETTMIVSQGLGQSSFMRILTPPEVVVVTLDSPYV